MDSPGGSSRLVLNVGGENKNKLLPAYYTGWEQVLLDLNPHPDVDLLKDARYLHQEPPHTYDAVYCAHNLEHYDAHEVPLVLQGFQHVLKPDGFAHIVVPDLVSFLKVHLQSESDLHKVVGHCDYGPVRVVDVIYGHQAEIEKRNSPGHHHKNAFGSDSLKQALAPFFEAVYVARHVTQFELHALGFIAQPSAQQKERFGLE